MLWQGCPRCRTQCTVVPSTSQTNFSGQVLRTYRYTLLSRKVNDIGKRKNKKRKERNSVTSGSRELDHRFERLGSELFQGFLFFFFFFNEMSRSFLVDSLIGNNSPPSYPLPYYGNQLPNYMFNFFNLGLGYQPIRPVPRTPVMPVPPVPISPSASVSLPIPGQSPPSPLNASTSRLSGTFLKVP